MTSARSAVMPMKVMSSALLRNAAITAPGFSSLISSAPTPARRASSRPKSEMTPASFPLALSSSAKYQTISMPTRSVPLGASIRPRSTALRRCDRAGHRQCHPRHCVTQHGRA
jgi:hypothetical protein